MVDRRQEAAADEDPRLGDRIAVRTDDTLLLPAPDDVGEEIVHLADLPAHRLGDDGVVGSLAERLDPEVDEPELRAFGHVRVGDRAEARVRVTRERLLGLLAEALPGLVEAGEIEIALGAEMAVEDRLGDSGLTRDL